MGSEKLLKKLKSKGKVFLAIGIIFVLIGLLLSFAIIISGIHPVIIAFLIIIAMGIYFMCIGINYFKGKNSRFVKKRPNILELADNLYEHTVYENKFVIISNKAIALKDDITKISDLNDVLAIYENIVHTKGITTSHTINLELRNGRAICVNVYARKKETTDNLVLTISSYCPNAKVGYSGETLSYLREQRKEYKNKLNNNK